MQEFLDNLTGCCVSYKKEDFIYEGQKERFH